MKGMLSFCGLKCHECPALLATQANDDDKRAEVARVWSKAYQAVIQPADINCDGCLADGNRLFGHCRVCEIRKCGREKAVANCAHCNDYACEKLEMLFRMAPDARTTLDEIHLRR